MAAPGTVPPPLARPPTAVEEARHVLRATAEAYQAAGTAAAVVTGARGGLDVVRDRASHIWALLALSTRSFSFEGRRYRYFVHRYNRTWATERAVEIPLALRALRDATGKVLEVGNVLSHYRRVSHECLDKYERAPGVRNADVMDLSPAPAYGLILAISTLEHVGWDESPVEPDKPRRAVELLKRTLLPGGTLLVTLPLGQNPHVDALLQAPGGLFGRVSFLKRTSASNHWRTVRAPDAAGILYGAPFPAANAVAVCTYTAPGGPVSV